MKPETKEWLDISERDLRSARTLHRGGEPENAAYLCQQAVEKLQKAILTQMDIGFPKTHDLVELADLSELEVSNEQRTLLTRLSDHAVTTRYPGAQYTGDEIRGLFEETQEFYEWLRAKLR